MKEIDKNALKLNKEKFFGMEFDCILLTAIKSLFLLIELEKHRKINRK